MTLKQRGRGTCQRILNECKHVMLLFLLTITHYRYGAAAYSKSGGKCFDVNVDIVDNDGHKILDILNKGSYREETMQAEFDKV